ncbi:MAG: UDP-glucose 4-epimerase GalE [Bacillota bacterium]
MKILVTGGAGYIASHTNVMLLNAGYEIVAVDNFSNSDITAVKNVEKITGKTITFIEGDVCNKPFMNSVFDAHDIYAVIHFAGLKAVGESCAIPLKYYQNNLISTLTLLEVMGAHNVKNFIFSSSATVYGIPETLPLTESSPLSTTNPYGATKLMGEDMLRDIYKADSSWHFALLRYFNPVGAHESGLIGEDPKGIPNNLMPYVAKVAFGELPYVNVFGNDYDTPDGTGVRDYIHVMDLAEGHLAALNNIEKFGATAVNLGTGVGYSVLEMVKAFADISGKPVDYKIVARRPGDIASCYASPDYAREFIGWEAKLGLVDMCRDLWNFQKSRI